MAEPMVESTPTGRPRGPRKWIPVLGWGLLLVPFLVHLVLLPSLGRLQGNDYYGVLHRLSDGPELTSDLGTWLNVRIVYHRVLIPALIWGLNIQLFNGHNLVTAALALGFLAAVFPILYRHLPPALDRPGERWLVAATISVLVFAPQAVFNLALSFGGIHSYLSDLLAILSIAVVVRFAGSRYGPWPLIFLGVAASFTFSSHLALWPALALGALVMGPRWRNLAVIALAAALAYGIFLWGIHPFSRPSSSWPGVAPILGYLCAFVGAPFTRDPELARTLGGTGLALSAALQLWVYLRLPAARPATAFWLMALLYGLGNGLLAALARVARFGEAQGMAARYQLFVGLFWAATVVVAALAARQLAPRRRRWTTLAGALTLIAVAVPIYAKGVPTLGAHADRGKRQEVAALAFLWSAWDEDLVRQTISINPAQPISLVELLQRLDHVPFDRPAPEMSHQRVPRQLLRARPHPEIEGTLSTVRSTSNDDLLRVQGWIHHPRQAIEEVVFVDRRRRRMSHILLGFGRTWLGRPATGWEGFVEWRWRDDVWTPYARLASDPSFYPLAASPAAERQRQRILAQRLDPDG